MIKVDKYPIPSVSDLYSKLGQAKIFSKIDMKAAYHQIPMHPDSIHLTAFICEFGLYEYLSVPMGISSAPAWFQRFIDDVLHDFVARDCLNCYLDDINLFSAEIVAHEKELMAVIARLQERNIKTSYDKSKLLTRKIEFLGNIIEDGEIKPHPKRASCLKEMNRPETLAQLQRLLGMTNYSRAYIHNYAELVKPLYDLMDLKNVPDELRKKNGAANGKKVFLKWNETANDALNKLIEAMSSDLVLVLPSFELDFKVTTDASELRYCAVLQQEHDGKNICIAFFSKCYTASQKNYFTSEKELLSIVMAIENWSGFLYGCKFTVFTDLKPLAWLLNKKDPHPRLERWMIRLAIYELEICYKPGRENVVADALSRLFNENEINENKGDEYFDILIAAIEEKTNEEENRTLSEYQYIEEIAMLPSSVINRENTIREQDEDKNIRWLKNLIITNGEDRPSVKEFENPEQRIWFKQ